tara:strand:+ start:1589 stop:2221 length:633 start_codon:yes stop_codon:yes gene_type:complete
MIPGEEGVVRRLLYRILSQRLYVAGIDEVGKGSLFGPVFAGAVILNRESKAILINAGLRDSKKLSSKKRSLLVPLIKSNCLTFGIGQSSAREIDSFGIRVATEKAMIRAIDKLLIKPELILVDGNLPLRLWLGSQRTIIRGDNYSPEISAASVIAKEARDNLIKRLAKKVPSYGLYKNVGYGTNLHRKMLIKSGPLDLHRISFLSKIINL